MIKKTNVFGLPINVGTNAEIAAALEADGGEALYVCERCIDTPLSAYPPSIRATTGRNICERCKALVWYDTTNLIAGVTIVCTHCQPTKSINYASKHSIDKIRRAYGLGRP